MDSPKIEFDGGEWTIPPQILDIIQKGADYSELSRSAGYRRILQYLEGRAKEALLALRNAETAEDRHKLDLQWIWREREKMLEDLRKEIDHGIAAGRDTAKDIDQHAIAAVGPFSFGDDEQ